MTSSRILLIFAVCALASIASASDFTSRWRKFVNYANSSNHTNDFITFPSAPLSSNHSNHSNSSNTTNQTAAFYYPIPISSNHSNHSNSSNTTNQTAAFYRPISISSNHSNHSNSSNTINHTAAFYHPIPISSNHSNHSNSSNTTNHTAASAFITFPSTPFFQFPTPSISSNHSNHSNHSNSTCTRVIAGQTFDLCAFKHPINATFYADRFAANFTLSLLNASVSDCNGTYGSSWMTARNSYGACVEAHHTPSFNLTRQYGESGLKIDYQLGGNDTKISVHLICNRTAPHNSRLDFAFNRTSNSSLIMTAQSYYGCPVNSSVNNSGNATIRDFGRKFLEF